VVQAALDALKTTPYHASIERIVKSGGRALFTGLGDWRQLPEMQILDPCLDPSIARRVRGSARIAVGIAIGGLRRRDGERAADEKYGPEWCQVTLHDACPPQNGCTLKMLTRLLDHGL
jgi:hypothetical protein